MDILIDNIKVDLNDLTKIHINRLRKEYEEETGDSISLGKFLDIAVASIICIQAQHDAINEKITIRGLEEEYDEFMDDFKTKMAKRATGS